MRDLSTLFDNPLSDETIPLDAKKKFGEDGLVRFNVQNTGGGFTSEIAAMTATQTALFGSLTGVDWSESQAEDRTQTVDELIKKFQKRNTRLNRILVANEVNKLAVYQQFFPQGVLEFTRLVTKENVEQRMEHMVKVVTDNLATAGGQPVLDDYTNLRKDYQTARGEQLGKFADTSTGRDALHTAETNWDDAFFNGLLAAAKANRNQPAKLGLFCNQSILRTSANPDKDGKGRLTGVVKKNGIPQPDITLHITDGGVNDIVTDEHGGYTSQQMPIGTYPIKCLDGTVEVFTGQVVVKDKGDTTFDIMLP